MRVMPEVFGSRLRAVSIAICLAAAPIATHAQTGIPVFPSPINVRLSTNGSSNSSPFVLNTATLNLTCPAGIVATVSSTVDGTGNVLVDNYVNVTATQGATTVGPTNICRGGVTESGYQDCFTTGYQTPAGNGDLDGDNPNGAIAASGGVAPIDISGMLATGANTIKFDEVDTGGYLAAASVYLYTNCSSGGASGGGMVGGNPISSTSPTPDQLTQPFIFSGADGKVVSLVFDLSTAQGDGTLTIPDLSTPMATDQAIDPAVFPALVKGTSFATSQCLIHLGELFNGAPACKLYTLTCSIGQGSESTGPQCPSSTARNVVIEDVFDFPPLHLPDIPYFVGNSYQPFHQGFGFLEPSDDWLAHGGGLCTFAADSGIVYSCPQNILTQFTGPGKGSNKGTSQPVIQSSFIGIGPVPLYRTQVDVVGRKVQTWVNSHDVVVNIKTMPPILPPNFNGGRLNGFVAASPYSMTYGVSTPQGLPSTEFPVPTDTTILYPGGCPTPGTPPPSIWTLDPIQLHVDSDGMYLIHYFATDCAGTEELQFLEDLSSSWNTTFFTSTLNVDTVKPQVMGPALACASGTSSCIAGSTSYGGGTITVYKLNSAVQATYQCTDDFSGVERCGDQRYSNPVTNPPQLVSTVDTSSTGVHVYKVHVTDEAGNDNDSAPVFYVVR